MIRWAMVAGMLALAGCGGRPAAPVEARPDWRFTIDGLAPLMSPPQVAAALARNGYRQESCAGEPLLADPLNHGDDSPCYRAAGRPMQVSLFFLDLHEGRRLAVVNFSDIYDDRVTPADRLAASRAFARRLRVRLGPPLTTGPGSRFTIVYWGRPGGQPSLPDLVSTTIGEHFGANVSMTSFWAYGRQRPRPTEKQPRGDGRGSPSGAEAS